MRRFKRVAIATIASSVCLLALPATSGAGQWYPTASAIPNAVNIDVVSEISVVSSYIASFVDQSPEQYLCTSDDVSPCDVNSTGSTVEGTLLFPVCSNNAQTNCVVSMALGTSAANLQPSSFQGMTAGPTVPADPGLNLPEGSTEGLWTNPLINADGSDTYATYVAVDAQVSVLGGFALSNFRAYILPYTLNSGAYQVPTDAEVIASNGNPQVGFDGSSPDCAWTADDECGTFADFAPGTVASMSIRLTNQVGGWFQGRIQDPTISVAPFNATTNLVTVTAATVTTPELDVNVPFNDPDPNVQSALQLEGPLDSEENDPLLSSWPNAFPVIDDLRAAASDTATGAVNIWSFGTLEVQIGNACLADTSKVLGFVSTNAMAYQDSPPAFTNGQLDYQVAGMHYMPDGTLTEGTYDLVMADSVARCLYNFSSAPISATISVTGDSGAENVATTSVTDDDGWLHLAAYGFTFSNPTIEVKLTQAKAKKPVKTTITCTKGKRTKKVTGVKPKCPAGFVKSK